MARRPKPEPKPAAPAASVADAAGTIVPQHEPAAGPDSDAAGTESQDAQTEQPGSALRDGDATGATEEASSATAAPKAYAVEVTGPAKGRWRAGRKFGPEPVAIPATELTEAQLRALDDDPEISLKMVPFEA
ncbi:MAG: hypothetical protein ACK4TJ_00070 [Tabrizicola sp.]